MAVIRSQLILESEQRYIVSPMLTFVSDGCADWNIAVAVTTINDKINGVPSKDLSLQIEATGIFCGVCATD